MLVIQDGTELDFSGSDVHWSLGANRQRRKSRLRGPQRAGRGGGDPRGVGAGVPAFGQAAEGERRRKPRERVGSARIALSRCGRSPASTFRLRLPVGVKWKWPTGRRCAGVLGFRGVRRASHTWCGRSTIAVFPWKTGSKRSCTTLPANLPERRTPYGGSRRDGATCGADGHGVVSLVAKVTLLVPKQPRGEIRGVPLTTWVVRVARDRSARRSWSRWNGFS